MSTSPVNATDPSRNCLCRTCGRLLPSGTRRCPACAGTRILSHPDVQGLGIAHLDCDSFYASVEKRDDPTLRDQPVIVGGGQRGVVSACCYVARMYGVRSAMPMFKARQLCPDAVVIRPDMRKYAAVGRQVRRLLESATPLVEPLSIDEAFLDLTGTEQLHGGSPAQTLIRLVRRIETEIGITASVGLSYNKFLAKVASDLDKPRGFAVIGRADALSFLEGKPVSIIWGVGRALQKRLEADGIRTVGQLRDSDPLLLMRRYGTIGQRLWHFARGEDNRTVTPNAPAKSISAETTFDRDLSDGDALRRALWPLAETVARRLKAADLAGLTVTLKLKSADFHLRSRSHRLPSPTQLADRLYQMGCDLLRPELDGTPFRLIGIGCADLRSGADADPPDLADPDLARRKRVEQVIDQVRAKLGTGAILKGRGLGARSPRGPDSADDGTTDEEE
ncbi:DNA polymerase IV [Oleisolibacter albus]|uniref:DNA polymerase IV n=1 Tax=Oleisolibacter albus TaxID=2171757 RepID=UPI000DF11156|nr:DNA polymerase IV [Oleisolibacter albus]